MVQHFLITRFNLKLKEWQTTKQGESVLSETWLTNRFELFKTYCLPSVKQQTNQNFKWLVCFDSETPDVFKAAINQMAASYSNFQPLYIDGFTDALEAITKTITSYLSASDTHIITTRLDNDDAVHKQFIETIQKSFKAQDPYIIDFKNGLQFIPGQKQDVVRVMTMAFNPFLSFVESRINFQTILSRPHLDWSDTPHISIDTTPLWMQIIHDENITNAEKLHYRETNQFSIEDFGAQRKCVLKSDLEIHFSRLSNFFKRILIKTNGAFR